MRRFFPTLATIAASFGLVASAMGAPSFLQGGGAMPGREAMWRAPTLEEWQRPCLITWQRTYDDAVRVSRETGKPILVCINMDGEIASEHYAGVRYRDAAMAALYAPYVTVIGSVYRHTPRDYDDAGARILCPRFGSVTCGEHISIEPLLFEKFLDGQRVAPRHIMVELDGKEVYDMFYAFDTDSVFQTIREGIENRDPVPEPPPLGDRTLFDRVTSADILDRIAVEKAYAEGSREVRQRLLESARDLGENAPLELLRLAIFGLDVELSRSARLLLAQSNDPAAIDLIAEALRVPLPDDEREALIVALERFGAEHPRAQTLAVVHRGLGSRSDRVDVDQWADALKNPDPSAMRGSPERVALESQVEYRANQSASRPEDPATQLEWAEATLALAVDPSSAVTLTTSQKTQSKYARLLFEDVQRAATRAEELGATGWRVDAALALAAYYMEDKDEAFRRAEAAVTALPVGVQDWNAMAVLGVFAEARKLAIAEAARAGDSWPPSWLTDVHSAYSVLARHPLGTVDQIVAHYDFLLSLGAFGRTRGVLEQGFTRFPDAPDLHARMRQRLLRTRGAEALEAHYTQRLAQPDASPNLPWFAGYASLVVAEYHRRQGSDAPAVAAYGRAIDHFEGSIESSEDNRASADHYIAMAHAGRARLALERGEFEVATAELAASIERKPEAASALDGLNLSARATAITLRARLNEAGNEAGAAGIDALLESIDPANLQIPEFDRPGANSAPGASQSSNPRNDPGGR